MGVPVVRQYLSGKIHDVVSEFGHPAKRFIFHACLQEELRCVYNCLVRIVEYFGRMVSNTVDGNFGIIALLARFYQGAHVPLPQQTFLPYPQ